MKKEFLKKEKIEMKQEENESVDPTLAEGSPLTPTDTLPTPQEQTEAPTTTTEQANSDEEEDEYDSPWEFKAEEGEKKKEEDETVNEENNNIASDVPLATVIESETTVTVTEEGDSITGTNTKEEDSDDDDDDEYDMPWGMGVIQATAEEIYNMARSEETEETSNIVSNTILKIPHAMVLFPL